jgi:hypothetical protein
MLRWLEAFALTLTVEIPIGFLLLRRFEPRPVVLAAKLFFANLATHPLVWFAFPLLPIPYWIALGVAETFAVVTEAVFYLVALEGLRPARAAATSLVANAASCGLGFLLFFVFHWPD